ncbi:MAG: DegQ family serine endoprotease [SAR86 cluster bacterium]|jgi:serine protease Do|uniref:Probable periplasmic serine endoprotease DegP-like n=1 Tax=SAR86 cluster bacterium TaxID=2030880 RepID=A0A973AA03_9GAMM|nr:DegQ family serine endoprotease [SAR86 cluster bacterium]|tara:strand:+ start:2523 stop:3908 length:1386 start_codon:yes stop_codon:yes gene_type:complete
MTKRAPGSALLLLLAMLLPLASMAALPEFTQLVKQAAPAVVNITATRKAESRQFENYNEDEVPELFRRFFGNMPRQNAPRPSAGSGFIISEDGYILTNNHVVENASEILVALSDRRERMATLVGSDKLSDLALLKIDAQDLPMVKLGSSEQLEVGEWVVAIGSPFGFEYSVTAGIVSAKGRSLPMEAEGNYVPFIQTDVAINPGNSGGPLFNLKGEVVGINSQIFTRSGGFMGLSFAIPIDVAMEVVAQLKDKGAVARGWLGVLIQRVDRDLAESFGMDRAAGALVTQVFANSPASKGGLREGDIIVSFDGKPIDLSSDLPHVVGRTQAESKVDVVVVRDSKRQTLKIKVGLLDVADIQAPGGSSVIDNSNLLGLDVRDLTAEEQAALGLDKGLLVVRVADGPGRAAGISRGDVITTLNSEWVGSAKSFGEMVEKLPREVAIPVRIVRNQRPEFLVIKVPR